MAYRPLRSLKKQYYIVVLMSYRVIRMLLIKCEHNEKLNYETTAANMKIAVERQKFLYHDF